VVRRVGRPAHMGGATTADREELAGQILRAAPPPLPLQALAERLGHGLGHALAGEPGERGGELMRLGILDVEAQWWLLRVDCSLAFYQTSPARNSFANLSSNFAQGAVN
jgi:hypothetical protein